MVDDIFRKFENERSIIKFIDRVLSYIKVLIDKSLKELVFMYLEMCYFFIYLKGKVDDKFRLKYGDLKLKVDNKFFINFKIVSDVIKFVKNFVKDIDGKLFEKEIFLKNLIFLK